MICEGRKQQRERKQEQQQEQQQEPEPEPEQTAETKRWWKKDEGVSRPARKFVGTLLDFGED